MVSVQRAFVQKLSSQHASDVRKHISGSKNACKNFSHVPRSSFSPCDIVDPPDFEDLILHHQAIIGRDPLHSIIDFPSNDIQISIEPRKMRTKKAIMPKEPTFSLSLYVRYCIEYYTRDWIIIDFCYRHHSTSSATRDRITEREIILHEVPYREFEIDDCHSDDVSLTDSTSSEISSVRRSVISHLSTDTCRSSWASFDLLNSVNDPLMLSCLDNTGQSNAAQAIERQKRERRQDALMLLYPPIDVEECIERRPHPEVPIEPVGHRIMIRCIQLKLELDIEPIFASMALYDCKERKKMSENFYFDMNSDDIKKLLTSHVPCSDLSTESKACILNITYPSPDLFLVIKLEKVLQGDINDCVEPYVKEEKNLDKIKLNAIQSCERLGKYRMPFCWTAIYLMNVINGKNSLDRDSVSDKDSIESNSLDRKMSGNSLEHLRKKASDISFTRKGSLESKSNSDKRTNWSNEDISSNYETFFPVTLTVSSFFKQEYDRLKDEDLYKFLQDLKRPSSTLKKLKTIPGLLKLDISPLTDDIKDCLTTELEYLLPCSKQITSFTKELLEFPSKEIYAAHYLYRNLLYIYPKELNFTGRPGNARNIAIKMEVKNGENQNQNLDIIFGKSSCSQYLSEVYTIVNYHSRCPYFYDEFKIQLPANIGEQHHLFFTFYHVSCQRKLETSRIEIPVGYTWLPLLKDDRLRTGDFCLPVCMEYPPSNYSYITPDVALPGIKWIDNHKGLFSFSIEAASSIHTLDVFLDDFFSFHEIIEQGSIPTRLIDANLEDELKNRVLNLSNAKLESLVKFLPIVINKLLLLLVKPLEVNGTTFNIGQVIFESIGMIVKVLTTGLPELDQDSLVGWHNILSTYVTYQCIIPHPINSCILMHQCGKSYLDAIDLLPELDREIDFYTRGITCMCNVTSDEFQDNILSKFVRTESTRILHEELALQWVVTSGAARENAVANSWFFFDLIIKSMVEYLASTNNLDAPRKYRFSDQFLDDIATLVTTFTSDIISGYNKDIKLIQSINASLAFFLYDLFSIADRGFVLTMLKTYYKHMSTKIATLPDAHMLYSLKIDFMRIIFSHEHFVALNLPFGTPFTGDDNFCSSPSPSVSSNNSQSSDISYITAKDTKKLYAENSIEFRRHHYLSGLLFSDLTNILNMSVPLHHNKIINLLRNLMTSHDSDTRYVQKDQKSRVVALYLPLLSIVLDMLPLLHSWNNDLKGRPLLFDLNQKEPTSQKHKRSLIDEDENESYAIHQSVAMAIAGTSILSIKDGSVDNVTQKSRKTALSNEASQNLFICFLWVLKNMDKDIAKSWYSEWSPQRMFQLLEALNICIARFEYKGKRVINSTHQQQYNKVLDIKSRLEDVILGQGSARSELMMRRKGGLGDRLRWKKDHLSYRSTGEIITKPKQIIENSSSHVEGNLAAEVSFVILDTLELILEVISSSTDLRCLMDCVFKVLLHGLSRNQSTCVLQSMLATQRSIVSKFSEVLFADMWENCADLCLQLLKHCSSNLSSVRSSAAVTLYILMRASFGVGNNFVRIRTQVTMSLSSLVGTSHSFNEVNLRRSFKTIILYAEQDPTFNTFTEGDSLDNTVFLEQVKYLTLNLHMILSDTVKMKEYEEDPEMLLDLMYRIAKGYQSSPNLRVTWLNNMAQKHIELNNHTEAAMCLVHSAALVWQYLHATERRSNLHINKYDFCKVSPNVFDDCIHHDISDYPDKIFCVGKDFTLSGLVGILEQAASNFQMATMFEAMDAVYKIMIPIIEQSHDYKILANIYGKLHEAYARLHQLQDKRLFGTYFRVGFYGAKFDDLNGEEFVYKEPALTKLFEIFNRLQSFYTERFGADVVQIIKDSNSVRVQQLDPNKAYIQITYVEPYFYKSELKNKSTAYERNFNISRFMFATPFTLSGRARGDLHEQYKRKTILTVSNHFPYIKTRLQVVKREEIILSPISVAIEDIKKKTAELTNSLQQDPPNTKILQMVLQGCIGTTVNQGPFEMAVVFLTRPPDKTECPEILQNKLRRCFQSFLNKCSVALKKNKRLIGLDQRDYQKQLERHFHKLKEKLAPLIDMTELDSAAKFNDIRCRDSDDMCKDIQVLYDEMSDDMDDTVC